MVIYPKNMGAEHWIVNVGVNIYDYPLKQIVPGRAGSH